MRKYFRPLKTALTCLGVTALLSSTSLPIAAAQSDSITLITAPYVDGNIPQIKRLKPLSNQLGEQLEQAFHEHTIVRDALSLEILAANQSEEKEKKEKKICSLKDCTCWSRIAAKRAVTSILAAVIDAKSRTLTLRHWRRVGKRCQLPRSTYEKVPEGLNEAAQREWLVHLLRRHDGAKEGTLRVAYPAGVPRSAHVVVQARRFEGGEPITHELAAEELVFLPEGSYAIALKIDGELFSQGSAQLSDGEESVHQITLEAAPEAPSHSLQLGAVWHWGHDVDLGFPQAFGELRARSGAALLAASLSLAGAPAGPELRGALSGGGSVELTPGLFASSTAGIGFAAILDQSATLLLPIELRLTWLGPRAQRSNNAGEAPDGDRSVGGFARFTFEAGTGPVLESIEAGLGVSLSGAQAVGLRVSIHKTAEDLFFGLGLHWSTAPSP